MFTYATRQAGLHVPSLRVLGFGTDLLDLDNDGDLDLAVANDDVLGNVASFNDGLTHRQPSQLFDNDGNGRFMLVPDTLAGPLATPRVGRGTMTLDADRVRVRWPDGVRRILIGLDADATYTGPTPGGAADGQG